MDRKGHFEEFFRESQPALQLLTTVYEKAHNRSPDGRFLESFTGRQAIIDLHVKGIIAFIDEYYKKDWRFID